MKKRTVLFLIYGLKYGGAEKLLIPLAGYFNSGRFRSAVIALTCGGPVEDELRQAGIEVLVVRRDGKFTIFNLFQLINIVRKKKADIIHSHLMNADIWGGIAAKSLGVKHISTIHGTYFGGSFIACLKQRIRTALPSMIVAVCNATKDICNKQLHVPTRKMRVIYNGIAARSILPKENIAPLRRRLGIREGDIVIGTYGRLEEEKGHRYLIEAIAQAARTFPRIILLVIGVGSSEPRLVKMARELNIEDHVKFLGERSDMFQLVTMIDIAVFPSLHEGFSVAILEAMAAGIPVIATSVGGTPELIKNGKDGILVAPENAGEIAGAIVRFCADKKYAASIASLARKKVERDFTEYRMLEMTEKLYAEVVSKKEKQLRR